jgi:hypothetical protein
MLKKRHSTVIASAITLLPRSRHAWDRRIEEPAVNRGTMFQPSRSAKRVPSLCFRAASSDTENGFLAPKATRWRPLIRHQGPFRRHIRSTAQAVMSAFDLT